MMKRKPQYQPDDKIGGRYHVHNVKMGGMGEVYLCLDLENRVPLALKTFQQRYQSSALRRAFEQEVSTWVALERHPNIVRCHGMDILDNRPFMLLEWIAGEEGKGTDLRDWLRGGPLELKTALEMIIDIVRGLAYAQEKQPGLVHRDLKPDNILVAQGGLAKITDFGLARIVAEAGLELEPDGTDSSPAARHSLSGQGGIVGTPPYMAPEQWRGGPFDERTDIYAVGCILYELLTGQPPFRVAYRSRQQWLSEMQVQHETAPLPELPATIPGGVGELARNCLAKRPDERPAPLSDLLGRLVGLYEQVVGPLPPPPTAGEMTAADYGNRGLTYHNLKQYQAALADYNRAIELNPGLAKAYNNRGNTYQALQQHQAALADYNRAIDLNPDFAMAYNNRGNTYQALQQYRAALADYNRAIDLNPDYTEAYGGRGITYRALQQHRAALTDFNRAIDLNPDLAEVYNNRGVIYDDLQQYRAALADYNRAIDLNPDYAKAYYNRGNTYDALQQYQAALADYNRAIDLNPDDAEAHFNLGALLANTGNLRESLPYFEKAEQLGDPTAQQAIAQVRQALGE